MCIRDKVVANLVAGSGADQADELGGFAVRYVLVRKGAPREVSRVLDATPGLSRLSQQDGSALWRVDRQVSRAAIVTGSGSGSDAGSDSGSASASASGEPEAVAAGPVEIHTKIPAASGSGDRILRIADTADANWTATLDGKPLTRTTVDGWAQGFQLPATGGRLDVTYDTPLAHSAWLWAQGLLAVVLVVLALPGRRRDVDDDLPDEPLVPAQDLTGDGRRARRLRERAENAEAAEATGEFETAGATGEGADGSVSEAPDDEFAVPAGQREDDADPATAVPQQSVPHQGYDTWDTAGATGYQDTEYAGYQADPYQGGQYAQDPYEAQQQPYQGDPYQGAEATQSGQYDPYAYGAGTPYDQGYAQGYDPAYDPQVSYDAQAPYDPQAPYDAQTPYDQGVPYDQGAPYDPAHDNGTDSERPHGSQQ